MAFPYDAIEPVKKGARGADVIQTVRLRSAPPAAGSCGKANARKTGRTPGWQS